MWSLWMLISLCTASALPTLVARDDSSTALPTLTYTSSAESSYTFTPVVDSADDNPYVLQETMPNGSVFIIFGSILLLLVVSAFLYFTITWAISVYKAKHQSEKYFYNAPLQYPDDGFNSSGSSVFERKSSFSNMSQLTLNQPLGRPYRNAKLENNRGSMFFSPTSDFILSSDTDSPTNFAGDSSSSFINLNSSALSLLEIGSGTVETPPNESKPKRPPSQYLEDLLAD